MSLFGAPFLILLCRRVGLGLGLFLILLAGTFGNALNAWYRPAGHISLGFSTALFGTVGVLSGFMALQGWGSRTQSDTGKLSWRRGILLLAAGTGILAMLGTEGDKRITPHTCSDCSPASLWEGPQAGYHGVQPSPLRS